VKNRSGFPINGARLTLIGPSIESAPQFTRTDANGTYTFTEPSGGGYQLEVQALGYIGGSTRIFLPLYAQNCNQVMNVALSPQPRITPTPVPRPNPVFIAYETAVRQYCRTATSVACSIYTADAIQCLSPAESADVIFQSVAMFKRQGLSSQQAVRQMAALSGSSASDTAVIAAAAAQIIDDHEHYDKAAFAMAIFRVCLAGVPR
jgi:hypothetical protein